MSLYCSSPSALSLMQFPYRIPRRLQTSIVTNIPISNFPIGNFPISPSSRMWAIRVSRMRVRAEKGLKDEGTTLQHRLLSP